MKVSEQFLKNNLRAQYVLIRHRDLTDLTLGALDI